MGWLIDELGSWLSSMGSKLQLLLIVVSVLALLAVLGTAIYYKNECELLTTRVRVEHEKAESQLKTLRALHEVEANEYADRIKQLESSTADLVAERDRLRVRATALQKRINSSSADECKARSAELLDSVTRGAELVAKCSAGYERKSEALKTCVRMYEDVKSVYDPAK